MDIAAWLVNFIAENPYMVVTYLALYLACSMAAAAIRSRWKLAEERPPWVAAVLTGCDIITVNWWIGPRGPAKQ